MAAGFETCVTKLLGILKLFLERNDGRNKMAVMRHVLVLALIPGADYLYVSLKEDAMSGGGKG